MWNSDDLLKCVDREKLKEAAMIKMTYIPRGADAFPVRMLLDTCGKQKAGGRSVSVGPFNRRRNCWGWPTDHVHRLRLPSFQPAPALPQREGTHDRSHNPARGRRCC